MFQVCVYFRLHIPRCPCLVLIVAVGTSPGLGRFLPMGPKTTALLWIFLLYVTITDYVLFLH